MLIVLFWLFCAVLSGILAKDRNRSVIIWGAMGLLFGIFAVIIIAVLPKINKEV